MLISTASPSELFGALVESAVTERRLKLSQISRKYLVGLLVRPADGRSTDIQKPLAYRWFMAQRLTVSPSERRALYRGIGDDALLLCGFWWQRVFRLRRQPLSIDYHTDLGKTAYHRLGAEPFDELAAYYTELIDVLVRVGTVCGRQDSEDILRLLDMWQATRSRTAASVLEQLGVPLSGLRKASAPS